MNCAHDLIPLAELRQELMDAASRLGLEAASLEAVRHRTLHGAVLDGLLPARRERGRWYVRRADLPQIASRLGVIPQVKKPGRPRKDVAPSNTVVAA